MDKIPANQIYPGRTAMERVDFQLADCRLRLKRAIKAAQQTADRAAQNA